MESAFLYFNAKNRQSHIPDEVLLPQNEPDINAVLARRNAIDVRRTHYPITYDFAGMSIFPYCADIPEEENDRGSVVHYQRLQVKTVRFAVNSLLSRVRMGLRRFLTGADHTTKLEEASKPSTLVPHQHTAYSYLDAQTDPFALYSSFYTLTKWQYTRCVQTEWYVTIEHCTCILARSQTAGASSGVKTAGFAEAAVLWF